MFTYYAEVLQSLTPAYALLFGTLIAGRVLIYGVQQLRRTM